jgi:hypothetical protein
MSSLRRFRRWLRYRRYLAALLREEMRGGHPVSNGRFGELKDQARRAAREVG